MLVQQKEGNIATTDIGTKTIDYLELEWYETRKRIMHKRTRSGVEVVIKFLAGSQNLTQGDILYSDDKTVIAVDIRACDAIIIHPKNMFEMASVCYEIGNKHLPLFYEDDAVLVAFEAPLFRLLSASGYEVTRGERKLANPLKTTVSEHEHSSGGSETLFSKIMRLTNPQE
jgi:urease accessory protein